MNLYEVSGPLREALEPAKFREWLMSKGELERVGMAVDPHWCPLASYLRSLRIGAPNVRPDEISVYDKDGCDVMRVEKVSNGDWPFMFQLEVDEMKGQVSQYVERWEALKCLDAVIGESK